MDKLSSITTPFYTQLNTSNLILQKVKGRK